MRLTWFNYLRSGRHYCNSCGFCICCSSWHHWRCRVPSDWGSSQVEWDALCYRCLWFLLLWAFGISEYLPINVWSHKIHQGTLYMVCMNNFLTLVSFFCNIHIPQCMHICNVQVHNLHSNIWLVCYYWLSHVWWQDSVANNFESSKRVICLESCSVDHGKNYARLYLSSWYCNCLSLNLIIIFLVFQVINPFTKYPLEFLSSNFVMSRFLGLCWFSLYLTPYRTASSLTINRFALLLNPIGSEFRRVAPWRIFERNNRLYYTEDEPCGVNCCHCISSSILRYAYTFVQHWLFLLCIFLRLSNLMHIECVLTILGFVVFCKCSLHCQSIVLLVVCFICFVFLENPVNFLWTHITLEWWMAHKLYTQLFPSETAKCKVAYYK